MLDPNSCLEVLDEEFDHPKDVVTEARQFMDTSVVAYVDLAEKTGLGIDKIGEKMDEAALDVDSAELFG